MIGKYSKNSVPAVGFSIGFERIVNILLEEQADKAVENKRLLLFYDAGKDAMTEVIPYADKLRADGYTVNLVAMKKKFGKQINYYEGKGYGGFMVFGRDEEIKAF